MKKTARKLLSMALALVMVLSMLPAMTLPALAEEGDTKDAFGITMADWTAEEKAAAEADLPFGTGYGTWTTLFEKNELFFSMGYDSATRLTGLFDWNEKSTDTGVVGDIPDSAIAGNISGFGQSKLTSRSESYKAVATAAMDLNGTGKKEYVANLAYDTTDNCLYLYVTDSSNNMVGYMRKGFQNVAQLSSMEVHQLNGAFSIAAGDFDGDGKDTIVVYVPQTDSNKNTKYGTAPIIAEYSYEQYGSDWLFNQKSTVSANVLTLLGNNEINQITTMKNQPMVDLVAEDVDKDGFDELIVTAGMNDVTNNDNFLESHIFIYDQQKSGVSFTWNRSYDKRLAITSENNKRVVWASSSVGNIMVNTSTTSVDYPEIISAGFIDGEQSKTQHINVGGDDDIGVSVVKVAGIADKTSNTFTISANGKSMTAVNVICQYAEAFNQKLASNSWTRGGFYESEDVNGLLQVQAYADRGLGQAESVFISGTVYRINNNGNALEAKYTHNDFTGKDDFAGANTLTNTTVTAVTAGNFNGNDDGREQLICVTSMKQSGKNNAYSRVYCYYAKDDGTPDSKRSSYLTEHKGNFYVSLNALDTDNDSVIARLESIERDYSAPDVLAILETSPYFAEIEDSIGNSETTYGVSSSEAEGSSNTFGFTLGVSVGYEFESDLIQSGGGFEIAVDNAFNWGTANTTSVSWDTEFRNDSGENLVVVYRCPVVTYRYVDLNGKELVVEKVGSPATNMMTVEDYNEAAERYDGLEPIDETVVKLGAPGDPASYRSSTNGLKNAVQYNGPGLTSSSDTNSGWAQYYGSGSEMQGQTISNETENTFSYDLAVSKNVFLKVGGVTAGATYGFTYAYETTHISGKSVTKSGVVTRQNEWPDYDFQWKFAAWNCTLNGSTVPVIGYLVQDVQAPPSPAMGLTAESFTTDSVTLRWSSGIRPAEQYRIYRVRDTAPQYVLVGAVQGDQTSFTLTGLRPGETYTYVVRGVSYQADGTAVESVDSAPITVRTQSEGSNVTLTLLGSSLKGSTLQSTGAAADIQVQVDGASGAFSYQWQLLEAGNAGIRNGWLDVGALAGKTIGAVKGATSSSLTLQNIDKSLNGSSLRCVVTVTTTAGDVDTYYSPVATLDLSGLDTTTTIKVTGTNVPGSGSITDPYTGTADHTTVTQEPSGNYVNVPATVKDENGKEYTIYQDTTNAENPVYVGVYDEVSDSGVSHTYRAVMKNTDGTYSLGDTLTLDDTDQYLTDGGSTYDTRGFTGFDGMSSVHEDVTTDNVTVRYEKRYVVTSGTTTLTEYWFNTSDGQYYTKTESGFVLADSQPDKIVDGEGNETLTNADIRIAYYDADGTVILSADGDDSYDHYQVYTVTSDVVTAGASFYRVPGTTLKNGGTAYADSAKLETVTVQKEVLNTVTTPQVGTQLTLSATVSFPIGAVSFTITNTDTGAVTQFTTTSGTEITWTAPKAGLYRIVATAAATATTKSSSAVCYYRADDPTNDYRLTLWQGNQQVTNISYNGSPVTLKLEERTDDTWGAVTSGVSYKVNGETITSADSSYTPGAAGSYTFSAQSVDGKTVATAMLVVNKVPITVTPTWGSAEGTTNTVPAYGDIKLAVTDAQGKPSSVSVADYMTVSCDLYQNGALDTSAQRGVYTVTPVYVNDTVKADFLSRYSVTLNTANIYYISGAITVYFSAGENGAVSARYIDPSGTEFSFNTGSQISMDYRLKFVASPNSGWSVDKWTVTVGSSPANTEWYSTYGNTLEFNETGMEGLDSSGKKELTVFVTFTDQTHEIAYGHGDGGSLSATAGGSSLTSGASVAHNAAVTFTAKPDAGMIVEKWTVDGAEYKWDGTDALYRENTLTLENISAAHEVQVYFTDAATTNVTVSAEDTANSPYLGATITVTDAERNPVTDLTAVPRSSALTFTVEIDNSTSAVVKEWQTSTDGTNWTTVTGSGAQDAITIYEHGEKLYVRAVIAVAQTYQLSWNVAGLESGDDAKATLVVWSGNVTLGGNGSYYAVNTPVEFSLQLDNSYYLVGWSENVAPAADGKSATLTLTDNTVVTVTVAKKPTVSWDASITGGTVSVTGTVNGEANVAVNNGGYVDPNTTITVTATPGDGYVVQSVQIDTAVNTNNSNGAKSKTIDVTTSNVTVSADFLAKPTVSITAVTGGTVEVTGTKDGTANATINSGDYVDFDTDLTVTLKPETGYEVDSSITAAYTDGTGTTTDDKAYTISGVQTNQPIVPVWTELPTADVSYSVVDKNGTDDGGLDGTLTVTVTRKNYAVTNNSDGSETVCRDSVVTFTATPAAGYKVGKWFVNGVEKDAAQTPTLTITDTTAQTVQVQFDPVGEAVTYSLTGATDKASLSAVYQANGSTQQDNFPSGNKPTANGTITFTVSGLADGYEVEGWYVNGVKADGQTGLTYTYSVTANVGAEVQVKIIRSSYTVTFTGENGTVSATVGGNPISSGDSIVGDTAVTFTAAPVNSTGYTFSGWTVNDEESDVTEPTLTLTITEDTVVKASYTQDAVRYTVTYGVIGENGTLSARRLNADNTAAAGSTVTFTATPNEGYQVAGWYSDPTSTTAIAPAEQNSYTLENLLANTSVYVAFEPIPTYNITVTVTGLGTVTATVNGKTAAITDNTLTVSRHDNVVLTATPDAYQYLTGWTLDSADQGNGSMTLTLTDVTEAHTVTADFAASQLVSFQTKVVNAEGGSLTAKAGYGTALETIDAATGISIEKGKNVVVTASPNTGYMVKEWAVNGEVQDNLSNTLTIENLSEATTVTVEFEPLVLHSVPTSLTGSYAISVISKTPEDYGTNYEIRDRGAATFTVAPEAGRYLTELEINGTDCLTSTGTSGPENQLTIQNNGDGSFTITVANVKQDIVLSVEAVEFQTVQTALTEVPGELQSIYGVDVDALQTALRAEVKQIDSKVPNSQTALFDIKLQYWTDEEGWQDADPEHFPVGGITVFIPYSDLGDTDSSYTFTVIHMFTTDMNGHTIGDTERIIPEKTETGIQFTVTSLSPFAIGWSKYTAPSGGGGGGGGGVASETVAIASSTNGKVTVDNTGAEEGDTVTLTVEPNKGYTLETLIVTDKNGNELELKDKGDGKYTFTMPASNVTVKATFMEDNSMLNFFVDVPADAYYYDAVLWAAENGITGGVDDTHFAPNATCTRAQAVTFLWRAAGSPAPKSSEMPFEDVAAGSYYYDAVLWAVENGITNGTSATAFSPNATCSRGQIVTFLWRSQKSPASDSVNPFADVAADAYYNSAVLWAVTNGVTDGTGDGSTFSPAANCTRAQIVTFLWRALAE